MPKSSIAVLMLSVLLAISPALAITIAEPEDSPWSTEMPSFACQAHNQRLPKLSMHAPAQALVTRDDADKKNGLATIRFARKIEVFQSSMERTAAEKRALAFCRAISEYTEGPMFFMLIDEEPLTVTVGYPDATSYNYEALDEPNADMLSTAFKITTTYPFLSIPDHYIKKMPVPVRKSQPEQYSLEIIMRPDHAARYKLDQIHKGKSGALLLDIQRKELWAAVLRRLERQYGR